MRVRILNILFVIVLLSILVVACAKTPTQDINKNDGDKNVDGDKGVKTEDTPVVIKDPGIYRSFSKSTASVNEEIQVTLDVVMDGSSFYIIDEKIPSGGVASSQVEKVQLKTKDMLNGL
jgi:hypothetical protein